MTVRMLYPVKFSGIGTLELEMYSNCSDKGIVIVMTPRKSSVGKAFRTLHGMSLHLF